MAKLYRVTAFVKDLNGDCPTIASVIENIENNRHPEFIDVVDVQMADCGEWHDDHELNSIDAPYEKYFPELGNRIDESGFKSILQEMRIELLRRTDEIGALKRQGRRDREELEKLKKVRELVKTIGDLSEA